MGTRQQEPGLEGLNADYAERYGFIDDLRSAYRAPDGLNEASVRHLSADKDEPEWMLEARLDALRHFWERPLPAWGPDLSGIEFGAVSGYVRATEGPPSRSWDDVPEEMKETFERLGIPQAEREALAGVTTQWDSEAVYHQVKAELTDLGVIFLDMDTALREHEQLVREHFATVIPANDNKFAALNTAFWSGGSFIWVPPGVDVARPLQTYFRINSQSMLQAERTLIIAEEGSRVSYIEGCSAPSYVAQESIHAAVVELIAKPKAEIAYFTVQNWDPASIYNLVTKRAAAYEGATVRWIQGELGSRLNMKYPSVYLLGERAHAEILSVAYAGAGQNQDTGGKVIHAAPNTSSQITSKSISSGGGTASYRGLVEIAPGATNARSSVVCDALILDEESSSNTWPTIRVGDSSAHLEHEASVSKVGEEQLFYLRSRGVSEAEARAAIVNGFIEPVIKELPMEYAVEMNRLIELQMEGSVG